MILKWKYCLLLLILLKVSENINIENSYLPKLFYLEKDEFCISKKEQKKKVKETKQQGKR